MAVKRRRPSATLPVGNVGLGPPIAIIICTAVTIACSDGPTAPGNPLPATNISAALLPTNNLGVAVTFAVPQGERARVRYWLDGTEPSTAAVTPSVALKTFAADAAIAVLGLLPDSHYSAVVQTISGADTVDSDIITFASGSLPLQLRDLVMRYTIGKPTAGYTLFQGRRNARPAYAVAFDTLGRIVWYRGFDVGLGGPADVKQQANGDITIYLGASTGFEPIAGYYVQIHPDGDVVATYQAPPPLFADGHDMLFTFKDGQQTAALFFGYEEKATDLTSIGGPADTLFAHHRLIEMTPTGTTRLLFPDENLFVLADRIEPPFLPPYDLAHPNSIDVDPKGNYIVSWRNTGEVTSFDPKTSHINWRLGGHHSTLTIVDDPLGGFSGQHCARATAADRVLIYDDGPRHNPQVSRAVEYQIDTVAKTARLVWSFTHPRRLFNPIIGCAQRLANGNTIVTYSVQGTFTEVSPSGEIVAEAVVQDAGLPHLVHRAQRIASLYGPQQ